MTNSPIHYYLRSTLKNQDTLVSFKKIVDYLMSFVGDVEVVIQASKAKGKEKTSSAIVYYIGTPNVARMQLEKTGQITVSISNNDNATINLINNVSNNIGFRIYNPQINAYLLNDVNIYDLTTIKANRSLRDLSSLLTKPDYAKLDNSYYEGYANGLIAGCLIASALFIMGVTVTILNVSKNK